MSALPTPSLAAEYQATVLYKLGLPAGSTGFNTFDNPVVGTGGVATSYCYFPGADNSIEGHAVAWNSDHPEGINLNPTSYSSSSAFVASNGKVYGRVEDNAGNAYGAVWSGTNYSTFSTLQTSGLGYLEIYSDKNGQIVGGGQLGVQTHAIILNNNSHTDLHPSGYGFSSAFNTDGIHQVGRADLDVPNSLPHAALWTGSAASFIDLNPDGYQSSFGLAVHGNQQVGNATPSNTARPHAMIWTGSAASAVDLNPSGASISGANDTNGSMQVGFADARAVAWYGSATAYIDLHALLPPGYGQSVAKVIDPNGDIYGIAVDANDSFHAVRWSIVPEPTSLIPAVFALIALRRVRR